MKISIVVAVYNEEEKVVDLLNSIAALDYPRDDFEVCLVNDGSADATGSVICKWVTEHGSHLHVKYLPLEKNVGRRLAREIGVKEAAYETILITDARCVLDREALKAVKDINYLPIIGNPVQKEGGRIGRVFFLLRSKLYPTSYGDSFPDVFITPLNFNSISKGTTILAIDRTMFLSHQPKETGKNVNEDTRMLSLIVQKTKILKTARVKCYYQQRDTIGGEIVHLYERGPRFLDHYYKTMGLFFVAINLSFVVGLILLIMLALGYVIPVFLFIVIADLFATFFFARGVADVIILLAYLPLLGAAFFAGMSMGLIKKIREK